MTLYQSILPMQALSEFYSATVRKGRLSPVDASSLVRLYRSTLRIVPAEPDDLEWAINAHHRYSLQFFDLLLCATVRRAGCRILLSEDMQHGQVIEGLRILNPFLLSVPDLDELMS